MNTIQKRRDFLKKMAATCAGGCLYSMAVNANSSGLLFKLDDEKVLNPKELNYCGYKCPENCKFLEASIKNDVELKKEAYKEWEIEGRLGIPFDAEKIYCFGCKNDEKPEGVILTHCTVRECAIEKEIDCCIECDELVDCEKDLWTRFPNFKNMVIDMQKKYLKANSKG